MTDDDDDDELALPPHPLGVLPECNAWLARAKRAAGAAASALSLIHI